MTATRKMGIPKSSHPVMVILTTLARVEVNDKVYLTDASNKTNSLGL